MTDNYSYIVHINNEALIIDPGEPEKIRRACQSQNLRPRWIVNTHYHPDHTFGNLELKDKYNCEVWGPEHEISNVPGQTHTLKSGEMNFEGMVFKVITAPGHTLGHILLYFDEYNLLFTGDVLFCGGCGRVFETDHSIMFASLQKIRELPPSTVIFCGHEYSLNNIEFAETLGLELTKEKRQIIDLRSKKHPSVPSTLAMELRINPFLRARDNEEFTRIRKMKDTFRSTNSN